MSLEKDDNECIICFEEICQSQLASLPCQHVFCLGCIKEWASRELSCPVCRATFDCITHKSTGKEEKVKKLVNKPKLSFGELARSVSIRLDDHPSEPTFARRFNWFSNDFSRASHTGAYTSPSHLERISPPNIPPIYRRISPPNIPPIYRPVAHHVVYSPPSSSFPPSMVQPDNIWQDIHSFFFEQDNYPVPANYTPYIPPPYDPIPFQHHFLSSSSHDPFRNEFTNTMDPILEEALTLLAEDEILPPTTPLQSGTYQRNQQYREVIDLTGIENTGEITRSVIGHKRRRET